MTQDKTGYALDKALALEPMSDGDSPTWRARVTTDYCNTPKAAFGGWINALAVHAVMQHADFRGTLQTMQTSFMGGVAEGDVVLTVSHLAKRARTDFWRVDMVQEGAVMVTVNLVSGLPRDSDLTIQIEKPDAPPIEDSQPLVPAPPLTPLWLGQYRQALAKGQPFSVNPSPESWLWIAESDDRPLDILGLVAMVDAPMPRTFFVANELLMGSTIQMQNHVTATAEQIAACGSDPILLRADSASIANSQYDQRVEAWSADGQLLMVSNQMATHR
ncbi:thioesterase family protein [Alterisphingorhabdus coralli]|uniref:Thioesterase family protein n=1 Tax=Alterisphingorhabdus coralli TaxID=3071408 RepID=A0AA97F8J4_9SPHN|nr:thioesterase family protein [Parasphingorhabdus sp. SCSIO 66989]WOE76424.1 thioesterase family protein [Parasphingorhabdus sp. SCSIO 66989]